MSRLASLKAISSLAEVAELLGFEPKKMAYILYGMPAGTKYRTFQIAKRSGGQRLIRAPVSSLRVLQQRLSNLLQDCSDEINTGRGVKDWTAHGFKRKRSIFTNARRHRQRRWVFNIDLEEFFPSINFGRVRGFFLKNRDFDLHPVVATVLAQIACHENSLPQGSPCSPVVSNLIAHMLDMRLVALASKAGCTYSRYADDLTFSTNKADFPSSIAVPSAVDGTGSHLWLPGEALRVLIEAAGFRINPAKTHLMYRSSRQNVTGLVVNQEISVRQEYRHQVRAMVHNLVTTGQFELLALKQQDEHLSTLETRNGTLNELHGMLGFIDSIDASNVASTDQRPSKDKSAREKVYRAFLTYSIFYAASTPVLLCEGETDNIYLTHAIRTLAANFPDLAETSADGQIRLKVRLYKYRHSSTARLLDLSGGVGGLATFIGTYKTETDHFSGAGLAHPVLIVYDNDDGAKKIHGAIKSVSGLMPSGKEPFVHIVKNLYAVPTPLAPGAADSKIEDFFDEAAKNIVVGGKKFDDSKGADREKHYDKIVFAHQVVARKAESINFDGFRPFLTNIVAAIDKHKVAIAPAAPGDIPGGQIVRGVGAGEIGAAAD